MVSWKYVVRSVTSGHTHRECMWVVFMYVSNKTPTHSVSNNNSHVSSLPIFTTSLCNSLETTGHELICTLTLTIRFFLLLFQVPLHSPPLQLQLLPLSLPLCNDFKETKKTCELNVSDMFIVQNKKKQRSTNIEIFETK